MKRASLIIVFFALLALAPASAATNEYSNEHPPPREEKPEPKPKPKPKPKEDKPKPELEYEPKPKPEPKPYPKKEHPHPKDDHKPKPKPKPKKVKCHHKHSPCHKKEIYCPDSCPDSCSVDCATCQPICNTVYPPFLTPPSSSTSGKQVRCKNKYYPTCYFRQFTCPAACPDSCEVDCVTCSPVCSCNKPGAVCQDPRFVGADGITFYFHGKKDQDFCLVSDSNLHINGHFIGKRNPSLSRDFTWVQSLGMLFDDHKLYIGALKTTTWNDAMDRVALTFDGQPILLPESEGATWQSSTGDVIITRLRATNALEIMAEGKFKITAVVVPITEKDSLVHKYGITHDDCFAHLDLSFKFYSLSGQVNGVLGQTYARNYVSRVKMGVAMPVLGGEKEFSTSSLFATDCAVARFNGERDEKSSEGVEFVDLNCATGLNGPGVVCKR